MGPFGQKGFPLSPSSTVSDKRVENIPLQKGFIKERAYRNGDGYGGREIHNYPQYLNGCQGKEGSDLFHIISSNRRKINVWKQVRQNWAHYQNIKK